MSMSSEQERNSEPDQPARRGFLRAAATAAAATVAAAATAEAQDGTLLRRPSIRPIAPKSSVKSVPQNFMKIAAPPSTVSDNWKDPVARLVRRISMGITADELTHARSLGYTGYLEEQLNPSRIDDAACTKFVQNTYPMLSQRGDQIYSVSMYTPGRLQLTEAALYRAAFSKRQLQERMVEFWTDHFNIAIDDVWYLKLIDDRDVIRRHALGRFPDMLRASANSAAMMVYLNQTQSRKGSPNQNYAREIMELHTVGVDGGYTQQDVAEFARVLTGWTRIGFAASFYDASIHDFGVKQVLGRVVPSTAPGPGLAGKNEAERIIDFLALHPNTAKYISTKLAKWFLAYDPPAAVVDAAAQAFLQSKGDIPTVLRVILAQANVQAALPLYKRPFHLAASAMRVLNPKVTSLSTVRNNLENMGQSLFLWPTPDGYPIAMEFWSGLVMQRWNAVSTFASASSTSTSFAVDPATFTGTSADDTANKIIANAFGGEVPSAYRTRLADYLRPNATSAARIRETMGLALASSQFQWF
jgi:uncharacterized protein (DUF1800 family)